MTAKYPPNEPAGESDLPEWLEDMTGERREDGAAPVEQKLSPMMVTLLLVAVALLGVIGYALYQRNQGTPTEGPAPAFDVTNYNTDLIAMPGERMSLDTLSGKTVVLNFWASYCVPCQIEAPMFERLWNEYRDRDVVFLGVNTDEPERDALGYLEEYGITYPNAPDKGGRLEDDFRITGIPETFVINGEGEIAKHFISSPNEGELRDAIERAMGS